MAPTAELTNDTPETQQRPAVFMARRRSLTLVRRPERVRYADGTGEKIIVEGSRINFTEGRYSTKDPDEIAWLREHELCGNSESGFFELVEQVPEPVDELRRIAMAAAAGNAVELRAVLEEEQAGHRRALVIESCESALAMLLEVAAQAAASAGPPAPETPPAAPGFGSWPGAGTEE